MKIINYFKKYIINTKTITFSSDDDEIEIKYPLRIRVLVFINMLLGSIYIKIWKYFPYSEKWFNKFYPKISLPEKWIKEQEKNILNRTT